MNAKRVFCKICEWPKSKVIAHTGKGDLHLGSYCPKCKKFFDLNGILLIPEKVVTVNTRPLMHDREISDILHTGRLPYTPPKPKLGTDKYSDMVEPS